MRGLQKGLQPRKHVGLEEREEGPQEFDRRSSRQVFWLPEDYLSGDVCLEVRCRPLGVGPLADFVAVFDVPAAEPEVGEEARATHAQLSQICCRGDEVEVSVLIDTVEVVNDPQLVTIGLPLTRVRLKLPDGFYGLVGE